MSRLESYRRTYWADGLEYECGPTEAQLQQELDEEDFRTEMRTVVFARIVSRQE